MMVRTPSLKRELESHGFRNVRIWSRGVDVEQFRPIADATLPFPRPILLYVGRVAIEKNIEAFLSLDLPGTKVVVGDRPGARRAGAQISGGEIPRPEVRRGPGAGLCRPATSSSFPAGPTRSAW